MWPIQPTSLLWTVLALAVILVGRFSVKLYYWRNRFHNLPGPPHSLIFGHIAVIAKLMASQPSNVAPQCLFLALQRMYKLPDCFFIDTWPFGPPMLLAMHPDIANQFTVKPSLAKHPVMADFTESLAGRDNIVVNNGLEWKRWRNAFNPGFSAANLMTLLPKIVDHVSTFCHVLESRAKDDRPFRLEPLATRLTIDIIGKVVLDLDFNSQLSENELVSAFESQVRWLPKGSSTLPLELWGVLRPLVFRYNTWRMDRYVLRELEERFATRKQRGRTKHVIDLALETYLEENQENDVDKTCSTMDKTFKRKAIDNIKIFLFAGHDTSSSTICYSLYHLSRNKEVLATVRKEIDTIFGPDISKVDDMIKDNPWLLNKMDYSLAVIREVLRLHPPASSFRISNKDFIIVDPEINGQYKTDGLMLWASNMGISRNQRCYGPDADSFRPERWLEFSSASNPNGDANVVFGRGNRNCIGQELALLEVKMVLAMTVRKFNFEPAFHELDLLKGDGSGYPSDSSGIQELFGEQAYQIQLGSAKPREGLPCRVKVVA